MITKSFLTQSTFILLFTILGSFILIQAQDVFIPLTFSVIFAFIVLPLSNFMEKYRFPRWLSTSISVIFLAVVGCSIILILSYQITQFVDDMPMLKGKFNEKTLDLQRYIRRQWGTALRNKTNG